MEMQFRTFPAFQGELIGNKAKHGKLSGDGGPKSPIGKVLIAAGAEPIPQRKQIEKLIKSDNDKFFEMFYAEYLQAGEDSKIDLNEFKKAIRIFLVSPLGAHFFSFFINFT